MEPAKTVTQEVYTLLCHHETDDGGVRFVLTDCGKNQNVQHKISQWGGGFICPYCAQTIQKACAEKKDDETICHNCEEDLQQYIVSKELCEHANQTIREVKLVCIKSPKDEPFIHTLDLGQKMICVDCQEKLTYKYQDQDTCKICLNKTKQLLANLKGSLANQELRMIRKLMAILNEGECIDQIKDQLEGHCTFQESNQKHSLSCKIKGEVEFVKEYEQLNHKKSKFEFYTKCPKHMDIPISVCNTCVAVLLNINMCPFGCDTKGTIANSKQSKTKVVNSTGFIIFSPLADPKHVYQHQLVMVLVQNISVSKKIDQSQVTLGYLNPKQGSKIKIQDYPTYAGVSSIGDGKFVISGGLISKEKTGTVCSNVWLFTIQDNNGQLEFKAQRLANLITARCSHSTVVVNGEVYVIGGFDGKQHLKSCEKLNVKENKWQQLPDLNFPRSKCTAFVSKADKVGIVVMGGLSSVMDVFDYGQIYYPGSDKWMRLLHLTSSFGQYPFSTGRVASSKVQSLSQYETTLLFGGSNLQQYSSSIDQLFLSLGEQKSFQFKDYKMDLDTKRAFSEIGVLETGDKNRKKIVLFGGCLEHESIFSTEVVTVQIKNDKTINPSYSQVLASTLLFSNLSRSQGDKHYKGIAAELKSTGRANEAQLKDLSKPESRHLLDTLWMAGKPVGNYQVVQQK